MISSSSSNSSSSMIVCITIISMIVSMFYGCMLCAIVITSLMEVLQASTLQFLEVHCTISYDVM